MKRSDEVNSEYFRYHISLVKALSGQHQNVIRYVIIDVVVQFVISKTSISFAQKFAEPVKTLPVQFGIVAAGAD
jgi:hypothetical protein